VILDRPARFPSKAFGKLDDLSKAGEDASHQAPDFSRALDSYSGVNRACHHGRLTLGKREGSSKICQWAAVASIR